MTYKPRVLVVDDEGDVGMAMKMALDREGYLTTAVTSPAEALDLVSRGDYDVMLTDLVMGETTGIELCGRVLEMRPEIPVIVVTAHGSLQTAVDAIRAGAYDFLTKPVDLELLQLAVARALQKRKLRADLRRLENAIENGSLEVSPIIGSCAAIRRIRELVGLVATSEASVLIQGETGTGKEIVARALHEASGVSGPFVALNCAAVPQNLLESELFGHARGAFTDARTQRSGLFVEANGGTIFLDEIGDLPLEIQPKLLRALQERKVRPIGSSAEVSFDARVVTATNHDLEEEVGEKRFREDLYYRINVMRIDLPPLRDRGGDIIELAKHFLAQLAQRSRRPALALSPPAAERLLAYSWPGNVRELENCIERAVVLARHGEITVGDLPEKIRDHRPQQIIVAPNDTSDIVSLAEIERRYILRVLALVGGNKARAAHVLGVNRKTLYRKLERFGVVTTNVRSAVSD